MFSQADLKVISTVFGRSIDEISGASSSDQEVTLGLRLNGKLYDEDGIKSFREGAEKQGKELAIKAIAKASGVDLDAGEKDPAIFAEKLKSSLSTIFEEKYKSQTPTEELLQQAQKAKEWEEKYTKLSTTYNDTKKEVSDWQEKYNQQLFKIKDENLNNEILSKLPKGMIIDHQDALVVVRNILSVNEEEGKRVIKRGDKVFTDPIGEPESLDNVLKVIVEEKGWVKQEGGMGGKNRSATSPRGYSPDQAYKYLKEKGIDASSKEGIEKFIELTSK